MLRRTNRPLPLGPTAARAGGARRDDHREQASLPHVVIVGGGFGGLQAARALGKAPVRVTVVDRTNHHLFQPLLYQVATAALSPADISAPIRHVLRRNKNTRVLLAEVTGIDVENKRVLLDERGERSLTYDYLIIATGAGQNYFGHPEWAQYAPGLKTLEDATRLRRQILLAFEAAEMESDPDRQRALLTFVLVGAGPTGVEMAGAIAELAHKALASDFRHINPHSARIILVEAAPRILLSFPPELAEKARRALNRLGVEVRTSAPVEAVDENGVVIAGEYLPAKTIIWTAGVAASPAGRWLKAEMDRAGRVKVNPDLSLPGHPEIFVIGDTAHVEENGQLLPGLAPVAMQEGRYVARAILQRLAGQEPPPFHYVNKGNLATVGRAWGLLQIGKLRLTGFLAWVLWLTVHIFYLIGFRNRVLVLFQWAWAYLTFQRGARLILYPERAGSREAVPLAALD
ncbi:NAD(P)/FAD-dependent oxidoreductase [Thermogemmatispora sp.]|uniref:NAD(P)/FAD-dependent oxidoreductase n=1 Tax=Thermogemmatispora sp. TaxID=1968838 RepID=UPI0035E417A2